jgi:hypothetical protein
VLAFGPFFPRSDGETSPQAVPGRPGGVPVGTGYEVPPETGGAVSYRIQQSLARVREASRPRAKLRPGAIKLRLPEGPLSRRPAFHVPVDGEESILRARRRLPVPQGAHLLQPPTTAHRAVIRRSTAPFSTKNRLSAANAGCRHNSPSPLGQNGYGAHRRPRRLRPQTAKVSHPLSPRRLSALSGAARSGSCPRP